ncbi:MAG TPA: hypothetical protein VD767_05415 [Thermomicrobiales bacterium]|nr:hypothetical protein [Thermomicrobiales bacterium]
MTPPPIVTLQAPAKINLGLEILGKRPDGYHEIRTVMAQVSLADSITVGAPGAIPGNAGQVEGVERNLIDTAISRFREQVPDAPDVAWAIEKRIPVAAGLGGASSNAAGALLALNALCGGRLAPRELHAIAASIGSDVPFFLGAPVAIASGRGVELSPIAAPAIDVLLVVPDVAIPAKTATLYSLLESDDFSDGSMVSETARLLAGGCVPPRQNLENAFCRALASLDERIPALQNHLDRLEVTWALSGAGPAHYVVASPDRLDDVQADLLDRSGTWVALFRTSTTASTGSGE